MTNNERLKQALKKHAEFLRTASPQERQKNMEMILKLLKTQPGFRTLEVPTCTSIGLRSATAST